MKTAGSPEAFTEVSQYLTDRKKIKVNCDRLGLVVMDLRKYNYYPALAVVTKYIDDIPGLIESLREASEMKDAYIYNQDLFDIYDRLWANKVDFEPEGRKTLDWLETLLLENDTIIEKYLTK
jgi:hypothetical protein